MGYTHYWTVPTTHPDYSRRWPRIVGDTRSIITAVRGAGIVVAGSDGHHRPQVDEGEGIAFNGDATTDLDHETFTLRPPGHGVVDDFCKTRKPYDLAVTCV